MRNLILAAQLEEQLANGQASTRLTAIKERLQRARLMEFELTKRTRFKYLAMRPTFIDGGGGTSVPGDVSSKDIVGHTTKRTHVLGAITDLKTADVRLYEEKGGNLLSASPIPTRAIAGLQSGLPGGTTLQELAPAIQLEPDSPLLADFTNTSSTTTPLVQHTLAFFAIYLDEQKTKTSLDDMVERAIQRGGSYPADYWLTLERDIILNGTLDQAVTVKTRKTNRPLLIHKAFTNCPNTRLRISDLDKEYAWSSDFLPAWCFAGDLNSQYPHFEYPVNYFLAPDQQLQIEVTNGQASGAAATTPQAAGVYKIGFICSTL
jgi:hypothetical protein